MLRGNCGNFSNPETKFPERLQRFGISARVIHGIVGMFSDVILLPLSSFGSVLAQAGVKIPDPAAEKCCCMMCGELPAYAAALPLCS